MRKYLSPLEKYIPFLPVIFFFPGPGKDNNSFDVIMFLGNKQSELFWKVKVNQLVTAMKNNVWIYIAFLMLDALSEKTFTKILKPEKKFFKSTELGMNLKSN